MTFVFNILTNLQYTSILTTLFTEFLLFFRSNLAFLNTVQSDSRFENLWSSDFDTFELGNMN